MILLYVLIDICFYNYTNWKTHIFLVSFLNHQKKEFFIPIAIAIDFFLHAKGRFFLILLILYFSSEKITYTAHHFPKRCLHYFILYVLYQLLTFIFFHKITFNFFGVIIDLLFVYISDNKIE